MQAFQFQHLTRQAATVVHYAIEEACQLCHHWLAPEHLLLGILREARSLPAFCLRESGLSLVQVRQTLVPAPQPHHGDLALSDETRAALNAAALLAESHSMRISSDHLLIGIAQHQSAVLQQSMHHLNVSLEQVSAGLALPCDSDSLPAALRTLVDMGTNLSEQMARDAPAPLIGREPELHRMLHVLLRRTKRNPVLVGAAGVGKTALIQELVRRLVAGETPFSTHAPHVIALDLAALLANTSARGDLEANVHMLVQSCQQQPTILFIDDLHLLAHATGQHPLSELFRQALARGQLQVIGATTHEAYERFAGDHGSFARHLVPITVEAPDTMAAVAMLRGARSQYEAFHRVSISDEALAASVQLSRRFLARRALPDSALDLLDEAAAQVRIAAQPSRVTCTAPCAVRALFAARQPVPAAPEVRSDDIAHIVRQQTGIPFPGAVNASMLRQSIADRFVGQSHAIDAVVRAVQRASAGLNNPRRPIGAFLLAGPAGAGKRTFASTVAAQVFGTAARAIVVDLAQFQGPASVSHFLGAPPGYTGADTHTGPLADLYQHPASVVVFEHADVAHPSVLHLLLQGLEDGVIHDSQQRPVFLQHSLIFLTVTTSVQQRANAGISFSPELLNRLDATLVFRPLNLPQREQLARLLLEAVRQRVADCGLHLRIAADVPAYLARQGDGAGAAEALHLCVSRLILDPLVDDLLAHRLQRGSVVTATRAHDGCGGIWFELDEPLRQAA